MKKVLLNLYFWPAFGLVSVLAFLTLPFLLLANLLFIRQPLDSFIRRGVRIYGWILVRVIPFMAPVRVENQNCDLELPAIFVANHNSSVDPYLFGALPYENAFVTTWPFKIPVYKYVMGMARYINANEGWDHVLEEGRKLMERGSSLIIWPEGHRSRDGRLRRFHNGAFRLAVQTGRPIVPVCIKGTHKLLAPGKRFLSPSRVSMVILPPIWPERQDETAITVRLLRQKTRAAFETELLKKATPLEGKCHAAVSLPKRPATIHHGKTTC